MFANILFDLRFASTVTKSFQVPIYGVSVLYTFLKEAIDNTSVSGKYRMLFLHAGMTIRLDDKAINLYFPESLSGYAGPSLKLCQVYPAEIKMSAIFVLHLLKGLCYYFL